MAKVGTDVGERSPYTGNIISKKITLDSGRSGKSKSKSSKSSGGGSSSGKSDRERRAERTKELQEKGLDRAYAAQVALSEQKGQKLTNIQPQMATQIKSGGVESKSVKSKDIEKSAKKDATLTGSVQGTVYKNLTRKEIERNKLMKGTVASKLQERTKRLRTARTSLERLNKGEGTSRDLLNVVSGGSGRVENILNKQGTARFLANRNERQKFINTVKKQLTPKQKTFYKNLPDSQKEAYLIQVTSRNQQPQQEQTKKPTMTRGRKLSNMSIAVRRTLENWANKINKRTEIAKKRQARIEAKQLAGDIARKELIEYFPTGTKTLSRGINTLINLGEKTFTGSLNFGSQLASAGEKAVFLLPALGTSVSSGKVSEFAREFVTPEKRKVLKDIYTDPKTYRDAAIGAGVMTILGGVRSGKLTSKQVKKIPRRTTKYRPKTILRDPKGNVGYVAKSGVVKPVPKGFKTITRALTRDVKQFNFRNVKAFPKTSNARVGTVYRNLKGELRIVTKGGKVVKPTPQQARKLKVAYRKGAKARVERTKVARKTKAKSKKGLSKKDLRLQQKRLQSEQINREIRTLNRKFKLKGKDLKEFKQAYKEFKLKGTKKSINKLQKISDEIEIRKGIKTLDAMIKRDLAKRKIKAPVKKKVVKKTAKGRISELERKALKKPLTKKQAKELRNLKKEMTKSEIFQARLKLDKQAQKKGFKNYEEQFRYEKAFREYTKGNLKSEKVLKSIEKKLASRKSKASKLRAKRIEAEREKLVNKALKLMKQGRRTLKQQVKPKKLKSKSKISDSEKIKLGNQVERLLKKKTNIKSETKVTSGKQQLVTKTKLKPKTKVKKVRAKLSKAKTPKLSRVRTVTSALAVTGAILNRSKRKLSLVQGRFNEIKPDKLSGIDKALRIDLKKLNDLNVDLDNLQDLGEDLTNAQAKDLTQDQKQAQKLTQDYKQVLQKVTKKRSKKEKEPIKPLVLPKLPKLNWNTKLPKGYSLIVNARYKKGGKVLNRRLNTTPNRARKIMNKFIDNNPRASYDLVVVGARKVKDIKKPSMKKFTVRKGKDPKVRVNVEKTKYRIDTKGEKRKLSRARRKKRKK